MKDKKVYLTEKEVLENPNDNKLGELVRKKFWNLKKIQNLTKIQIH